MHCFYARAICLRVDFEHDWQLTKIDGFSRLRRLRAGLAALDRSGWERSYHQRVFHEEFINAIVRVLFKTDPPGAFERSYPRLLESNNWTKTHQVAVLQCVFRHIEFTVLTLGLWQEILISTPRRFGKTISVCLFVAALMYAAPSIEISIYSTCKRISQKLLRNCMKFLQSIHDAEREPYMEFARKSMDEVGSISTSTDVALSLLLSTHSCVRPHLVANLVVHNPTPSPAPLASVRWPHSNAQAAVGSVP